MIEMMLTSTANERFFVRMLTVLSQLEIEIVSERTLKEIRRYHNYGNTYACRSRGKSSVYHFLLLLCTLEKSDGHLSGKVFVDSAWIDGNRPGYLYSCGEQSVYRRGTEGLGCFCETCG